MLINLCRDAIVRECVSFVHVRMYMYVAALYSNKHIMYKWIHWRVEYLVNFSKNVVGIVLIWRTAACSENYLTLAPILKLQLGMDF